MAHTSGPWLTDGGCIVDTRRNLIAVRHSGEAVNEAGDTIVSVNHGIKPVEADSNARLIAAAPELLEACKRAAPWLGKMIADQAHLNSTLPNDCVRTLEMLEAVIAKAGQS